MRFDYQHSYIPEFLGYENIKTVTRRANGEVHYTSFSRSGNWRMQRGIVATLHVNNWRSGNRWESLVLRPRFS